MSIPVPHASPEAARTEPRAVVDTLRWSRFAQRLLAARPELADELAAAETGPWQSDGMRAFLATKPIADAAALGSRLRELRARVLLRTALRDLSARASLEEVVATMSDLAAVAIAVALDWWTAALECDHGVPTGESGRQPLVVVGMGKLGGRELNVSSDIDLVFVYPEEGETRGAPAGRELSNHEFFVRLGKKLITTLADRTHEGQVFRVDMRLRPWGDAGPLASSYESIEAYFLAQGREWERYAWIKGRVVAVAGGGPAEIARRSAELEALVRPFVYRKYLDYGTIAAIRALHAQIRQEVTRRDLADHIKLGPGGIREIEFIAQAFQLVRGGRVTALRLQSTLAVLDELVRRGQLDAAVAEELAAAYVFLRRLEHRLQYLDDAQTHALPAGDDDRALVAEAMGFGDWHAFQTTLAGHRARVSRHFDATLAERDAATSDCDAVWNGDGDRGACEASLAARGYRDPAASLARLRALRDSSRYRQLPSASKERVDALVPRLIEEAAKTPDPGLTLARGLDLVETVSRRAAYLALLKENPQALERVARLVGASPWAAEYLTRHPILLDELLDARLIAATPDWLAFSRDLARAAEELANDNERLMDVMRELHHAAVFRLLAQDLAGLLTIERLADHLSLAADLVLAHTVEICWRQVRARHRECPRFGVIAYGKLGGKELGYASDLDLVFVYDDADESAAETYVRLAQRMSTWLSSRTSAGVLFETDFRLRPSGEGGLLVSSLEAFRRYQLESAWAWEHQAITRARFVAGDAAIGALVEALRRDILTADRDRAKLADEVLAMRKRMRDGHPNRTQLFDLKHDRGGMVDIEFIVQFLVLAYSCDHWELTGNLGNLTLLRIAGAVGLIPYDLAMRVAEAYRLYRREQHVLRLGGAEYARVPLADVEPCVAATRTLWRTVFGTD
jgi:glutamate-ammonia-ligase adenylyltransferase